MTLEPYEDQPVIPSQRFQAEIGGSMEIASATDRLVQRLEGLEEKATSLMAPQIEEETIKKALIDVSTGQIDSDNVAMVARDIYKKTAGDAFLADLEIEGTRLAKKIEADQIASGSYDAASFNRQWESFAKTALTGIKDIGIKNELAQRLAKTGSQYGGAITTMQARQERTKQKESLTAKLALDIEEYNSSYGVNQQETENIRGKIEDTLFTMEASGMISPETAEIKRKELASGAIKFNMERDLVDSINTGRASEYYQKMQTADTKKYEGFSNTIYQDTEGNDTIGYGHKLTLSEKRSGKYKNGISQSEALKLYNQDKAKHTKMLYDEYPGLKDQPRLVREALEDMAYNMGVGTKENKKGFSSFKSMLDAIENRDYMRAGQIIRGSKYAKQVGRRAIDNAMRIESGELDPLEIESYKGKASKYLTVSKKQANTALDDATAMLRAGKTVDMESIMQSYNNADENKQREFRVARNAYTVTKAFSDKPLSDHMEYIENAKTNAKDIETLELAGELEKQYKERASMAVKDPVLLNYQDSEKEFSTITIGMQREEMQSIVKERANISDENIYMYGRGSGQMLTDAEAGEIGRWVESPDTPTASKIDMIGAFMSASPEKAKEVFRQLNKKGARVFSMVGALMLDGKHETADKILRGATALKEMPNIYTKDLDHTITGQLGNVFVMAGAGQTEAMVKSARNLASFYASERGDEVDDGDIKDAIKEISNGIASRNDQDFFLPPGKDEGDVDDVIDDLTVDDLPEFAGLGKEEALRMIQDGGLISVGTGRYRIRYNRKMLYTADGKQYELEIK